MKKAVRDELTRIEKFLCQNNAASKDLWNILSALRGPDKEVGKEFTKRVRRRAFPRLAKDSLNIPASFGVGSAAGVHPETGSWHFDRHIRSAFRSLTLR